MVEDDKVNKMLEVLEERLWAIEGVGNYGLRDVAGFCLVPDVVIPAKFKVPEFKKYRGTTCPKSRMTDYVLQKDANSRS